MHRKTYKTVSMLILVLSFILLLNGCSQSTDGLVAKVNGEEITEEKFNIEFESFKGLYEKQFGKDAMSQIQEDGKTREEVLKEDILEKMIRDIIIKKESEKMNISVSEDELNEKIKEYINEAGGEEEFKVYLKENDIGEEFYKKNLRKELLESKHKKKIMEEIKITEEEAKEFFENNKEDLIQVKVSHILVKTEEEGQEVLNKINNGQDFAEIAKEMSADNQSSIKGGDIGYITKGIRPAEFEEVAFSLDIGEVSEIIKMEVGYHIIKAEDRKDTYESLKEDIDLMLKEEGYLSKMEKLRQNEKIKVYKE